MTRDTLLHIHERLDPPRREALIRKMTALAGAEPEHHSHKPHLLWVPYNKEVGMEGTLRAVRAEGLSADVIDL